MSPSGLLLHPSATGSYGWWITASFVRRAAPSDGPEVAAILAEAFASDPIARWVLDGRRDPERDLRTMFAGMVREAIRQPDHQVHLTDDGSGAAVWFGIDRWKMSAMTMLRLWPSAVRTGFARARSMRLSSAAQKAHPRTAHYYLELIGTRPALQGKGTGTLLMRAMLERCDRDGVPAYLESSNPQNIPFYRRHGFELRPSFPLPKGCPPHSPMWRDPRPPAMD